MSFSENNTNNKVTFAKEYAIAANQVNMEIGQCMLDIEANNKTYSEFPVQFIAFAEKIREKLDETEVQLLTHLTKKALEYQKATTDNFQLVLKLAEQQRARTEQAIKIYEEVAKNEN